MTNLSAPPVPVKPGDLVSGKYAVEKLLGVGAVGIVVSAMHLRLNERVAIKFLRREAMASPDLVSRFAHEARAAAKMKGEHVARVLDVDALEDGTPFIVMEYLEGADLSHELTHRGALPVEEAVEYALHVCEALAEAHALGVVHRDIKPANLFLLRRDGSWPSVKVLDFGISKSAVDTIADGSADGRTDGSVHEASQMLVGSPIYMSPEQIRSSPDVDHRSDLWSLGVVLYELLTTVPPFQGGSVSKLSTAILEQRTPSIRAARVDVPAALDAVVRRCLDKTPGARFQSAAELANALAPFAPSRALVCVERATLLSGRGARISGLPSNGPSGHTSIPSPSHRATNTAWVGTEAAGSKRSATSKVAMGAGVAVMLAVVLALFVRMRGEPRHAVVAVTEPDRAGAPVTPVTPAAAPPAHRDLTPEPAAAPSEAKGGPSTVVTTKHAEPHVATRHMAAPAKSASAVIPSKPSAVTVDIGY